MSSSSRRSCSPRLLSTEVCSRRPAAAFVALLYGTKPQFLVCAFVLGRCLQRHYLGKNKTNCVLLITIDSTFAERGVVKALGCFWKVRLVPPICMAEATNTKRHELAFTKLHMFCVNAARVLFLDLDILVRTGRIAELFKMPAPAGMYHGRLPIGVSNLTHGQVIDQGAFDAGACVNAGVMRIDTASTKNNDGNIWRSWRRTLLGSGRQRPRACQSSTSWSVSYKVLGGTWLASSTGKLDQT